MEIVNNISRKNHFERIKESFKLADEIVIISPFISKKAAFFPFGELERLKEITIITTLKGNDIDQYNKVPFFKELYEFAESKDIKLKILVDNSLHGKIYISKLNGKCLEALITSANFTNNGLRVNNEWGTIIKEEKEIKKIEHKLIEKIIHKPLTKKIVDDFWEQIKGNPLDSQARKINLDLSSKFELKDNPFKLESKINYWLKPIGTNEENIPRSLVFDEVDLDLHFSKQRPSGIKVNDILIAYAVGHANILSIYRVKSEIKTDANNDRWPHYVIGENLTPYYGQNWSTQNITISNQKETVLKKKLFDVTPSGKNSYGSLMRGADKLNITKEFGEYLINKIGLIDNKLKSEVDNI